VFLKEDLERPGTIYEQAEFSRLLDFFGGCNVLFQPPIPADFRSRATADYYKRYAARLHREAIAGLVKLQFIGKRAEQDVRKNGRWADIREQHLPAFQEIARVHCLSVQTILCDKDEAGALIREDAIVYANVTGTLSCPLPPPLGEMQREDRPSGVLLRQASARKIVRPFDRIFGIVCGDALAWLGDLDSFRCLECGAEPPDGEATRSNWSYCSNACKQANHRRTKGQAGAGKENHALRIE
jgi:hypothetical protein